MSKAIVWSQENCTYCDQAKSLLKLKGIEYEERKLGEGWTKKQLLDAVPTARSVPQIFLDENYVGGFNELKRQLS
jgi:glutaredoxin